MENIIKEIEEASVYVPREIMEHGTGSGIPMAYTKGVLAGRQQALEIIKSFQA